jgi:hypothetical protein
VAVTSARVDVDSAGLPVVVDGEPVRVASRDRVISRDEGELVEVSFYQLADGRTVWSRATPRELREGTAVTWYVTGDALLDPAAVPSPPFCSCASDPAEVGDPPACHVCRRPKRRKVAA